MNERNDEGAVLPLGLNLGIWDRMTSWDEVIEIARLADELGYDCLLIPESFGRDGVTLCDRLLAATAVSDRLADSVSIAGSIADCANRIDQLLAAGADRLIVTMPAATRAECEPLLEGIIPARCR